LSSLSTNSPDEWAQAFPFDEARRASEFLVQIWAEMSLAKPDVFSRNKREPQLTEILCHYVRSFSSSRGRLTGLWTNEDVEVHVDEDTNEIVHRIKKDITYFSNRNNFRLVLIFEFKKLKNSSASRKAYAEDDGMLRFVQGRYGPDEPVVAMVGLVVDDRAACVSALRNYLNETATIKMLNTLPCPMGNYIRDPSATFPMCADFDTEHARTIPSGTSATNVNMAHFFLTFN
jgi:hypothetical protein